MRFLSAAWHDGYIARGTFNICFFVQFCSGERWVVRIPLRPCLAISSRSKLESEVATMFLIAERTDIPTPKIIAYALDETESPISTFVIMEYVAGERLSAERLRHATTAQKECLYRSLSNVYIQLRRLEFPATGWLVRLTDQFEVGQPALTYGRKWSSGTGIEHLYNAIFISRRRTCTDFSECVHQYEVTDLLECIYEKPECRTRYER